MQARRPWREDRLGVEEFVGSRQQAPRGKDDDTDNCDADFEVDEGEFPEFNPTCCFACGIKWPDLGGKCTRTGRYGEEQEFCML